MVASRRNAAESESRWVRHTVRPEEAGLSVQEILVGPLRVSRRMIQRLTRSRGITLNSRPAFLDRPVRAGDVVAARVAEREAATLEPVSMALSILFEDSDLLALDKPAGVVVHPTSPHHTRTLAHGIAQHFRDQGVHAKVRPIHRLDRETSGVLLVARSAFAHQHLDRQLREGRMSRQYFAVVEGLIEVDEGIIDRPIGQSYSTPNLRVVRPDGKPALTRYSVADRLAASRFSLVRVYLETGRTHQIRVHFASIGHPVVGDRAYGATRSLHIGRPALHAERLQFQHPRTSEAIDIGAPLPPDITTLIDRLNTP